MANHPPTSIESSRSLSNPAPAPEAGEPTPHRLVASYLKAILGTLRDHYGTEAAAGTLYLKGEGEDPKVDRAVLIGGTDRNSRVVLSLGAKKSVMEGILDRGPRGDGPPLGRFVALIEQSLERAGKDGEFSRLLSTAVQGDQIAQSFLTTGTTVVAPLKTLDGVLFLQIAREACEPSV